MGAYCTIYMRCLYYRWAANHRYHRRNEWEEGRRETRERKRRRKSTFWYHIDGGTSVCCAGCVPVWLQMGVCRMLQIKKKGRKRERKNAERVGGRKTAESMATSTSRAAVWSSTLLPWCSTEGLSWRMGRRLR